MGDNVRNRPHVLFFDARDADGDGWLTIESHAPLNSPDPNISLSGFWVFPEHAAIDTASVINGSASRVAEIYHRCGTECEENSPSPRMDELMYRISGQAKPYLAVRTRRAPHIRQHPGRALLQRETFPLVRARSACRDTDT
jgi:hypothetical protein